MRHYVGNRESTPGFDENWFERFCNGDKRVMKVVFDRYYPKLVVYAEKYLFDLNEAEEIGLIALETAWERRNTYESSRHLNNELYIIARNESITLLRKHGREDKKVLALERLQSDAFDVNRAVDPERARAEALSRVWQEIYEALDKRSADMLRLHFKAGLPDAEIAEMHQTTVGNVQQRRSRALDKLRKLWGKDRFWMVIIFLVSKLP
jgi:RNA polymerase sigma-70 factor (ECF subfamily)